MSEKKHDENEKRRKAIRIMVDEDMKKFDKPPGNVDAVTGATFGFLNLPGNEKRPKKSDDE